MKPFFIAILAVVVIGAIAEGVHLHNSPTSSTTASATPTPAIPTATPSSIADANAAATPTPEATTPSTTYKDGSYTANGSYVSPGGQENITVSVTVANDTIKSVTVTPGSKDPDGVQYEGLFAKGISSVVVGKPLSTTFNVSEVNGSSLTGTGFTAALNSIRSQAKS